MPDIPVVIGYKLSKAKELLGESVDVIIENTSTPYENKILERKYKEPVVVKQKEEDGKIRLVTCKFK